MVNNFYDLVTDFYEYGWGQCFHFAPRMKKESFEESILRHEYYLALRTGLKSGMKVIDLGCGVGGPARNISAFSGAQVVGLNNNDYQIKRAKKHTEKAKLQDMCSYVKGDYMDIQEDAESYDAAYAIESIVHASERLNVYREVYRILKPGSAFAGYEWCMTDKYDPSNHEHQKIKEDIEEGNGLQKLEHYSEVSEKLKKCGFVDVECTDVSDNYLFDIPWQLPISGREFSFRGFSRTSPGRFLTHFFVSLFQIVGIAPNGSVQVSSILNLGADALLKGGDLGIFSPTFFFYGRKPNK